jgi:hypothetical protein
MSRPRWAALRLAESRCGGLPQRAGDAAIAVGEGWPPAEACGRGDGAKKAFILPIRLLGRSPGGPAAFIRTQQVHDLFPSISTFETPPSYTGPVPVVANQDQTMRSVQPETPGWLNSKRNELLVRTDSITAVMSDMPEVVERT